ncbi:MAG: hypothetical protein JWM95_1207 [Gemmatimonadetes bacterium]|nr:hypothetical protein [Gemmatimonadota bacterium]
MIRQAYVVTTCAVLGIIALSAAARPAADLSGNWRYAVPEMRFKDGAKSFSCAVKNNMVHFKQAGNGLKGYGAGGTITCDGDAPRPYQYLVVDSGMVRGDSVFFTMGPAAHRGRIVADSIIGTLSASTPDGAATGEFRMSRAK